MAFEKKKKGGDRERKEEEIKICGFKLFLLFAK